MGHAEVEFKIEREWECKERLFSAGPLINLENAYKSKEEVVGIDDKY